MAKAKEPEGEFDSDELTALMVSFGERGAVIRSYCLHVMTDNITLEEWRRRDKKAPTRSTWYHPFSKNGKYWGSPTDFDPAFREYIKAYWSAMLKAQHQFMLAEARKAQSLMQRSATQAANRIKQLAMESDNHMVALQASKFVYSQQVRAIVTDDEQTWDTAETTTDDGQDEGDAAE